MHGYNFAPIVRNTLMLQYTQIVEYLISEYFGTYKECVERRKQSYGCQK
jgi:hypothetical protein